MNELGKTFFNLFVNERRNLNLALNDIWSESALGETLLDILAFKYFKYRGDYVGCNCVQRFD